MPLDPTDTCLNFRDVGEFVNLIAGRRLLPERRLYRGGSLDAVFWPAAVGMPATIVNLRRSADPDSLGARVYHLPITNDLEKYETGRPEVRRWLGQVVRVFERPDLAYPTLIHCTAGRDRTGVAVAALLRILDIPEPVIVEEYLLSDGDVQERCIRQVLGGIGNPRISFRRADLTRIRTNLLGET